MPLLGEERFHLGPGGLGLLLTVPAAANLVFQPAVGVLADRLGRRALVAPTVVMFSLALLAGLPFYTGIGVKKAPAP